jgi:hypothetical protein
MGHACDFIETNRILAWLLGCLAAVGGKSFFLYRPKLMGSAKVNEKWKAR